MAYLVELPENTSIYPMDKTPHITTLLNGKKPFYSNLLIKNIYSKNHINQGENFNSKKEELVWIEEPIVVSTKLKLMGKHDK